MKLMKLMILLSLGLNGCGINGEQKVTTNDSKQEVTQSGESYTYVVVRLEFIEQINKVCTDANPIELFETETLQRKAIADCTLKNMQVLNINLNQVSTFTNDYCAPGADLSSLSPQQILDIQAACALLGQ